MNSRTYIEVLGVDHDLKKTHLWCKVFKHKSVGCLSAKFFQKDKEEKGKKPAEKKGKTSESEEAEVFKGEAYERSVPRTSVDYIESGQEFRKRRRHAYIAYLEQQVKMKGKSSESDRLLQQAKRLLFSTVKIKCEMKSEDAENSNIKTHVSYDMHMVARTKRRGRGKIAEYPQKRRPMKLRNIRGEEGIEWYSNVDSHGRCEVHMASFVPLNMIEDVILNTEGLTKAEIDGVKSDVKGFLGRHPLVAYSAKESEKMQQEKFGLMFTGQNSDDSDDASNDSEDA